MLVYLIFFIANFVVAYFYIYDADVSYVKPFWHSIVMTILVGLIDLIKDYMDKRKN